MSARAPLIHVGKAVIEDALVDVWRSKTQLHVVWLWQDGNVAISTRPLSSFYGDLQSEVFRGQLTPYFQRAVVGWSGNVKQATLPYLPAVRAGRMDAVRMALPDLMARSRLSAHTRMRAMAALNEKVAA